MRKRASPDLAKEKNILASGSGSSLMARFQIALLRALIQKSHDQNEVAMQEQSVKKNQVSVTGRRRKWKAVSAVSCCPYP